MLLTYSRLVLEVTRSVAATTSKQRFNCNHDFTMPLKLWDIHTFRQEFTEIQGFKQQKHPYKSASYMHIYLYVLKLRTCSHVSGRSQHSPLRLAFSCSTDDCQVERWPGFDWCRSGSNKRIVALLIGWQCVANKQLSPICRALSSVKQIFGKMKNAKFLQYKKPLYMYIHTYIFACQCRSMCACSRK